MSNQNGEEITVKVDKKLVELSKLFIGDGKTHSTQINLYNAAIKNYLKKLRSEKK